MRSLSFALACAAGAPCMAQPQSWTPVGPGGGGALFVPSYSPLGAEINLACDMSEQFHSTNLGASWAVTDFRQIQGNREAQVRFTSNPAILYALDYTNDLTTPSRRSFRLRAATAASSRAHSLTARTSTSALI